MVSAPSTVVPAAPATKTPTGNGRFASFDGSRSGRLTTFDRFDGARPARSDSSGEVDCCAEHLEVAGGDGPISSTTRYAAPAIVERLWVARAPPGAPAVKSCVPGRT